MPLSTEQIANLTSELKQLGSNLNLSDDQKEKLRASMSDAYERFQQYKAQNPNATKEDVIKKIADNRASIRQRLVNFLTPEQLSKWDAEVGKAREFLGQKIAA
jgi:periplasmic protein CpxP/Spy